MKKALLLSVLIVLVACTAMGQTVHYLESATLNWDVVTEDLEGNPFPVEDIVEYEVYRTPYPVVDGQNPSAHTLEGIVSSTTLDINIPNDDVTYAYGVRTKVTTDGGATELYSLINWSDVNGLSTPNPFLYRYPETVDPRAPMGFAGS